MSKSLNERVKALEEKVGTDLTTRILVIQDRSGSMMDRIPQTISGYNEYVGDLADDDSDKAYLTLVQFDDRYEVKEEATPVGKVKSLDTETFVPRGMTALLDAVGKGITEFKRTMKKGDRAFVVIMTDGGENASSVWGSREVSDLITSCEDEGNWTFTFLGAGRDAWSGGQLLGLSRDKAVFYGSSEKDQGIAFKAMSTATSQYRGASAMSASATGASVSNLMVQEGADEIELEEGIEKPSKKKKTSSGSTKR